MADQTPKQRALKLFLLFSRGFPGMMGVEIVAHDDYIDVRLNTIAIPNPT
jgi:hypothetical protein